MIGFCTESNLVFLCWLKTNIEVDDGTEEEGDNVLIEPAGMDVDKKKRRWLMI